MQKEAINKIRAINEEYTAKTGKKKKYFIFTTGCQMNAHDSEKLSYMLTEMGYEHTETENEADFILYNTCCIRENAEEKVYGRLGYLKYYKEKNRDITIALCGCMMQQDLLFHPVCPPAPCFFRVLSHRERCSSCKNCCIHTLC